MNKILCYISFLISAFSFAQEKAPELYEHRLNESKWEDIKKSIRYENGQDGPGRKWTYETEKDYNDANRKYKDGNGGRGFDGAGSNDGASERENNYQSTEYTPPPEVNVPNMNLSWLGYLLLILLAVALIFLIFYFFMNRDRKGKAVYDIPDIQEVNPIDIPLTELQRLLKEALENKDYRGAVRIYFIFTVRGLTQNGLIRWEKEKTNFQYLREMVGRPEYDDFNRSVSYFEIIWYGKRDIDLQVFEQIKPSFTKLLDRLGIE